MPLRARRGVCVSVCVCVCVTGLWMTFWSSPSSHVDKTQFDRIQWETRYQKCQDVDTTLGCFWSEISWRCFDIHMRLVTDVLWVFWAPHSCPTQGLKPQWVHDISEYVTNPAGPCSIFMAPGGWLAPSRPTSWRYDTPTFSNTVLLNALLSCLSFKSCLKYPYLVQECHM